MALSGTVVGGAMHPRIDALAPGVRLTIEIIDIGKRDSCPEALLDDADRPLDFALRLGSPSLADPWRNADRGHEIGKERVPPWDLVLHFQQHALHAVGQRGFGQPAKVLKGLHQTADHRWGITALDKGHKAHARVTEDRGEPVELVGYSLPLILELAPIELDLLARLRFVAHHRVVPTSWRTQGMHKGLEHAQAPGVALFQQAGHHVLAVVTVILGYPLLDLLFVRIQFGATVPTSCA